MVWWRFRADQVYSREGFNEPNALAIIGNDGSGDNHNFQLYVREKDPKAELWDGARSGTQAAVDVFNADEVSCTEICTAMKDRRDLTFWNIDRQYRAHWRHSPRDCQRGHRGLFRNPRIRWIEIVITPIPIRAYSRIREVEEGC